MKKSKKEEMNMASWRTALWRIIYKSDTFAGRSFDAVLLFLILVGVLTAIIESVESIDSRYNNFLRAVEWSVTVLFTVEYIARIISVRRPKEYILSLYGFIDFISIFPTYIAFIFGGHQFFLVLRMLRLLRVFRVFKAIRYIKEAQILALAIEESIPKVVIFLETVTGIVVILGTLVYLVEGPENGFTSIPQSMYWAIGTLSTVGYGDIIPHTPLGKFLASLVMLIGYGLVAVPTGIVSAEFVNNVRSRNLKYTCGSCGKNSNDKDANYCKFCGAQL